MKQHLALGVLAFLVMAGAASAQEFGPPGRGDHFPATYGYEFYPGNMWDELMVDEETLARAHPGLFKRERDKLTVFQDGRPFAEFVSGDFEDESATWRMREVLQLYDPGTGKTRIAFALVRGAFEYVEGVLLDYDGRVYAINEEASASPDGHLVLSGGYDDMSGSSFLLIDWPNRKVYGFSSECQATGWRNNTTASLVCLVFDEGLYVTGSITVRPAGKPWELHHQQRYESPVLDGRMRVTGGVVSSEPLPNLAPETALEVDLLDQSEVYAKLGYRFLGGN